MKIDINSLWKMETEKELELRRHLREEFVNSGFIQVFQWKNFTDYFNIELNKVKQEVNKELQSKIMKIPKNYFNFKGMPNEFIDKPFLSYDEVIKLFEEGK